MREIKVRAWYKPYKQMCQVESLRFDGNGVYTAVLIEEPFYDRFVGECAGVAESLFELTNLEVVGNIHEDFELLEEK